MNRDVRDAQAIEIGGRLKAAREAMGKTQKEMGEAAGGSFRTWQDYEHGKSVPGGLVFAALSAMGLNPTWLLTGEGEMRPGEEGPKSASAGGIDRDLLAAIHKGVAEVYRSENARISADPLADEVARIYDDLVATYDSPDERLSALKLALHQLRRDLRAPAAGGASRKQVS